METKRTRTKAHFPKFCDKELDLNDLLALAESAIHLTAPDMIAAVQNIYEHPLLKEVLSMPYVQDLKQRLHDLTAEEARELLRKLKTLPCAESSMVAWSNVLSSCVGSNTAPYQLGAGLNALAAMYYLVKYLKKEAGAPNTALAVLIDARDHIEKYGSKNAKDGTPANFARHLMQRTINKSDQELSGTQAASIVIGAPSLHAAKPQLTLIMPPSMTSYAAKLKQQQRIHPLHQLQKNAQ